MKDRFRLALRFDAAAMRGDLAHLEASDWIDHFVPQNYEGTWSILPLRAPAGATHPIKMVYSDPSCNTFVDTPWLARCPYFQQVLATFDCPLNAVRLMKLAPGSIIKPHTDHDLAVEHGRVRLHIPIVTNQDVDFRLNGERIVMGEGECWYLRLSDTHSVANRGQTERVHLVIDAVVTPWLERQLTETEAGLKACTTATTTEHDELTGWIPFRIGADRSPPIVDWCYLGEDAFTDSFFSQTVDGCRRKREHGVRSTTMETLIERRATHPGIAPTAFIFHTSRCGSTLFSQMAAALPRTIVISEAPPIDEIVRCGATESERIEWLQALLAAFGRNQRGDARHLFVKFDAWHIVDLALVQRAFPNVPCVFLYRDPAAVVASQLRMPGLHMVPGMVDPSLIGLDLAGVLELSREEHIGRMLGALYAAGLTSAQSRRIALMNYSELPDGASSRLLAWCGLTDDEDVRERLRDVARFDAKTPALTFDATDATHWSTSNQRAIENACRFITDSFTQLESIRA